MKKAIGIILSAFTAAAVVALTPVVVKAEGMPCTEATLKEFIANKEAADRELLAAQAAKAEADANVAMLKAQGVTGLELLIATDAATNADNVVKAYMGKVSNAQIAIDTIKGRGAVEQYYLDMEVKWKNRAAIDNLLTQIDGEKQLVGGLYTQLENLKSTTASLMSSTSDPQIKAELDAKVLAAEADYANEKAKLDALQAECNTLLAQDNWATNEDNENYGKFVRDYINGPGQDYIIHDYDTNTDINLGRYHYQEGNWYIQDYPTEWSIRWFL